MLQLALCSRPHWGSLQDCSRPSVSSEADNYGSVELHPQTTQQDRHEGEVDLRMTEEGWWGGKSDGSFSNNSGMAGKSLCLTGVTLGSDKSPSGNIWSKFVWGQLPSTNSIWWRKGTWKCQQQIEKNNTFLDRTKCTSKWVLLQPWLSISC